MSIEALVGMLDDEIERAIEPLRQSRREMKTDIAALEEKLARRRQQREEHDFTAYYRDEKFDAYGVRNRQEERKRPTGPG
jgi:hypothetical protein